MRSMLSEKRWTSQVSILNPSESPLPICSCKRGKYLFPHSAKTEPCLQGQNTRQKCVGLPHTLALHAGAKAGTVLNLQTLVVERSEEGVAVCSLKEGIFNLHLPPAQLLAASKPLGQSEYALTLFHLLLDGMESVLCGLWGCSQPRALEDRHSFAQIQHVLLFQTLGQQSDFTSSSPGVGATRNHPPKRRSPRGPVTARVGQKYNHSASLSS